MPEPVKLPVDQPHCMLVVESAVAVKLGTTFRGGAAWRMTLLEVFDTVAAAAGVSPAIKKKSGIMHSKLFIFLNSILYTSAGIRQKL